MIHLALICLLASSALAEEDTESRLGHSGFVRTGYGGPALIVSQPYVAAPIQQPIFQPSNYHHQVLVGPGHPIFPVPAVGGLPTVPLLVDGSNLYEDSCRTWCLTPEKVAYCCEEGNEPASLVGLDKPGYCPVFRQYCPQSQERSAPPRKCSNDHSCLGADKCCYDRCLDRHVCKPPRGPVH